MLKDTSARKQWLQMWRSAEPIAWGVVGTEQGVVGKAWTHTDKTQ